MKSTIPLLLAICTLALAGCARHYTITLNSGSRITTLGKPKLQNGFYVYKDSTGKQGSIPSGRVREVAPSNMTTPRVNSGYKAEPMK